MKTESVRADKIKAGDEVWFGSTPLEVKEVKPHSEQNDLTVLVVVHPIQTEVTAEFGFKHDQQLEKVIDWNG